MAGISRLKPDTATQVGVMTALGVYLIYQNALPNVAELRSQPAHDDQAESARKGAAYKSAALIIIVGLVARDINSYIISGAALVGIDYMYKHANATNPSTNKLDVDGSGSVSNVYSMPEYTDSVG